MIKILIKENSIMKKIAILSCALMLSSCIRAGGNDFFPQRRQFIEDLQTTPITYYDNSMKLVKTELDTERNFPENKVLSAGVGYSVVDDKTYRKVYYARDVVRSVSDGVLSSRTLPIEYKKSQQFDLIGEVFVDGQRFALVPTSDEELVLLIDEEGKPYNKLGQIRKDRIILINDRLFVYPKDFGFETVMLSKSEQTTPLKGFDIKYGGLRGGYVSFIYYKFDAPSNDGKHDSGEFEVLSYPNRPGPVDVKGIKIKIVDAKTDSLDYMILPN